jgi:hypothetical protein
MSAIMISSGEGNLPSSCENYMRNTVACHQLVAKRQTRLGACSFDVGPVIRINPDELHFNDPDFHDEIFTSAGKIIDKPPKEANAFGPYSAVHKIAHFHFFIVEM